MERRLRKKVEWFLAGLSEAPDPRDAAHLVRARLVATLAEGLETEDDGRAGDEKRPQDLGLMAAYLDGQLAGSERHSFETSLMDAQGGHADLNSASRLVSAVECEQQELPAELLARAQSELAIPPAMSTRARRAWKFRLLVRAAGPATVRALIFPGPRECAVAALCILLLAAPSALFVLRDRGEQPSRPEAVPSKSELTKAPHGHAAEIGSESLHQRLNRTFAHVPATAESSQSTTGAQDTSARSNALASRANTVDVSAGIVLNPRRGLEGNRVEPAAIDCGPQTVKAGDAPKSMGTLQYAAEQGNAVAQWKLGRMYATGEGVTRCDLRAFEYFSRIANDHADDYPDAPQALFVANAFVALGQYYLDGIPNSQVKPDPNRAREMFSYAASYFGNADAQYQLARIYLDGHGVTRDPRQAARWFTLAANKGQYQAQAMLGYMLFKGEAVPRETARGLMWLTLARDSAKSDEKWISELYDSAFKQANNDERVEALAYLERWLKTPRE